MDDSVRISRTVEYETTKPTEHGELAKCFPPIHIPVESANRYIFAKKLDPRAQIPKQDKHGNAGYDLHALDDIVVPSLFKRCVTFILKLTNNLVNYMLNKEEITAFEYPEFLGTKIKTGIALEIPYNYVGLISDRSGMGSRLLKVFGGVIDSNYRGDVTVCLANFSFKDHVVKAGDRVAQIVVTKCLHEPICDIGDAELTNTERADSGFGSSGR